MVPLLYQIVRHFANLIADEKPLLSEYLKKVTKVQLIGERKAFDKITNEHQATREFKIKDIKKLPKRERDWWCDKDQVVISDVNWDGHLTPSRSEMVEEVKKTCEKWVTVSSPLISTRRCLSSALLAAGGSFPRFLRSHRTRTWTTSASRTTRRVLCIPDETRLRRRCWHNRRLDFIACRSATT